MQDEQRIDLLRAMIMGPVDTPYQGGAYLFDILLPQARPAAAQSP